MNLDQFNRILRHVLLLPIMALMLTAAALYWEMHDSNRTVDSIQVLGARVAQAGHLEQIAIDEETGLRGYEMTHDPQFLQPFNDGRKELERTMNDLQTTLETPEERSQLDRLRVSIEAWEQGFAIPLIATIKAGGETTDVGLNLQGKHLMDTVRGQVAGLIRMTAAKRNARVDLWRQQAKHMTIVLGVLALAVGVVLGIFARAQLRRVSEAYKKSLNVLRVRTDEIFRSEQHLRTTLDSIGDAVITCDSEGRVQTMNPVAQSLTGWSETEARSLPLDKVFDIVNETTRELVENPVDKVRRLNRIVGLANHTVLRRKGGGEIQIDDSGAPIVDQRGQLAGVVLVFRDITMQRKSQAALLANEKLAVAGRLAATIAHEIHNPLDSVSNLLFLMDDRSSAEETAQFLQMAKQELARVTQISRAMLSLYRESKAPVSVDLKVMLDSVLLLMERRFLDQQIHISTDVPADLVIRGFPGELRQVFTNLLANAAEAAGEGGTVTLRLHVEPAGMDEHGQPMDAGAVVVIGDDGPGIPEHIRGSLFQPFFTTKGESGTGLGLWVSKGIIKKHGGTITLDSDTDPAHHGTQIRVFLAFEPLINPGGD